MTSYKFGNVSIDELEKRLNVRFLQKDKHYLQSTHSKSANVTGDTWHVFDLPFLSIVVGSVEVYLRLYQLFKSYNCEYRLSFECLESFQNKVKEIYENKENSYPNYLLHIRYYVEGDKCYKYLSFLKYDRETSKSVVYRHVCCDFLLYDVLGLKETSYFKDYLVPNNDRVSEDYELNFSKDKFTKQYVIQTDQVDFKNPNIDQHMLKIIVPWKYELIESTESSSNFDVNKFFDTFGRNHKSLKQVVKKSTQLSDVLIN